MSTSRFKNGPVATKEPVAFHHNKAMMNLSPQTNFVKTASNSGMNENSSSNNSNSNHFRSNAPREKGVVEKLLHSYGFVQCTDRKGRLFFHYSEVQGKLDLLNIGDSVEFHESTDRRTGKPVAVSIVKLSEKENNAIVEIISGKPVTGLVLAEARSNKNTGSNGEAPNLMDGMGRVTYEQGGETFFLPFALEDIEDFQKIDAGDQVEFHISTDERNGNLRARRLRKQSISPELYQGVVCSMKDNYGFIERSDVVKEIFFHFSEYDGDIENLLLGDDVEFNVQIRNNKEVAVGIIKLPEGTVIFEDVARERKRGRIKKTLKLPCGRRQSDALAGRIVYETVNGPIEISYGDKDPIGDFTLRPDDIVEFCIATDRRDKVQHATNIRLTDDTFIVSQENREKGFVTTLKEGFGFIRCTDREARMFFHFSETLDPDREISLQDEVEFTVVPDPTNASRQVAVRIKNLPKGSISVEQCLPEKYTGSIEKEAGNIRPVMGQDPDPGIIMYDINGTKQMIPYSSSVVDGNLPKSADKVEFQISECQKNKTKVAVNVRVVSRVAPKEKGFIVTMKEGFGFIETADHEKEIFFHFSNYEGDVNDFELGDEVEFNICHKSGKVSAENLHCLPKGSLPTEELVAGVLDGKVVRTLHVEASEYSGLIQIMNKDGESLETFYPFGIMSLVDKRDLPQKGDSVRLQVSVSRDNAAKKRATRVAQIKRYVHAKVDSILDQGGTLNYDIDGSKLSFLSSDVQEESELYVGDDVEFVVVHNLRGTRAAYNLRKICERPRPERLISRLKSVNEDQGPKVTVVRQPRGPDGSKGFKLVRQIDLKQPTS